MKKLFAAVITAALLFTPIGTAIFQDQPTTVDAKRYSSGKKGFNFNNNNTNNNNSFFQNKKADPNTTNKSAVTPNTAKKGFSTGGFMKGLMVGGLAGLLFGSLFANMGFLGSILGLMINVLAIIVLISLIRGIFTYFKNKKKKEDVNPWRS